MNSPRTCSVCGGENTEADFFCRHCGAEMTYANRPSGPASVETGGSGGPAALARRVCPKCGQANDAVFPLCRQCGFDLAAANSAGGKLTLLIGQQSFECSDGDVLGRDGTIAREVFSAIGTVSRRHVQVSKRNGRWFIMVPATVQNIAELDGRELPRGVEHPLTGEHRLKLSTQCEVTLKVE